MCFAQEANFARSLLCGPLWNPAFSAFNRHLYAEAAKIHRVPQRKPIRYATFVKATGLNPISASAPGFGAVALIPALPTNRQHGCRGADRKSVVQGKREEEGWR